MASYYSSRDSKGYILRLDVSETGTSTSGNYSTVSWALYIESNSGYYFQTSHNDVSVNVDGNVYSGTNIYIEMSGGYSSTLICSGNKTIYHNSDGSKTISVSASFNNTWGADYVPTSKSLSGSLTLTKIPRYATCNQSLNSKTLDAISMDWSSDSTCDYVWYSLDGGSWTEVGSVNASSGSYTISGLSPNTTYSIKTRVRRKDSQLTTDSSELSITTYNYGVLSSAPDFNDEDNPTITYSNDMGEDLTSLQACIASSDGQTIYAPYRDVSKTGTSYTFNLTESERDALLDACVNDTMQIEFALKTIYNGNTYYSVIKKIFTSTGGKVRLNVNGVWKKGTPYINVNGTWKKGRAYLNVGGTWKRSK